MPLRREKLSLALEQEGYLKKVLETFRIAEQNHDTNALHQLYQIFRNIFLLNKNAIFEILFAGKRYNFFFCILIIFISNIYIKIVSLQRT